MVIVEVDVEVVEESRVLNPVDEETHRVGERADVLTADEWLVGYQTSAIGDLEAWDRETASADQSVDGLMITIAGDVEVDVQPAVESVVCSVDGEDVGKVGYQL